MSESSLYEQIGGAAAVGAAVEIFYGKVLGDSSIAPYFAGVDMNNQRRKMNAFMTMAFGGPNNYTGQDMRNAHKRLVDLGLNDSHFDAVAGHVQATLDELNVPAELSGQVMTIVGGTRDDVLNR